MSLGITRTFTIDSNQLYFHKRRVPMCSMTVTIFRTFVIPKRDQLANNGLSREIRVWINIADISNDINAFSVAYPISASICTLSLFLKRIIDCCRSRPSNENSCISIIQFECIQAISPHPISIQKRSIWNYFSKRLKQNIPHGMTNR